MKLKFLGVGGAFAPMSVGNSNMLLSHNGKNLLIDCGFTAPYILRDELGIQHTEIDGIYISHLHGDHTAGLEHYAFMRYFVPIRDQQGNAIKPKLYAERQVMKELWEGSLKGSLEVLEGRIGSLTDYFDCIPLDKGKGFQWEGHSFFPVETVHVSGGYVLKYSYGLAITNLTTEYHTFITTDTQFRPHDLGYHYKWANIIFHDCETLPQKSGVHPHYDDLVTLPEEIKGKMYLYHYSKPIATWEEDGFGGFVRKSDEFTI